jgi:hypothetical protein
MTSKSSYAKADPLVYQRRVIEMRETRRDDLFPCGGSRKPVPYSVDFSEKKARNQLKAMGKAKGKL